MQQFPDSTQVQLLALTSIRNMACSDGCRVSIGATVSLVPCVLDAMRR